MPPPLNLVRVLDFSRVIAGPLCTQHLADLGAEVIKIENPITGDEVRGRDNAGGPGRSSFFMTFNRSKKSVALDISTAEGQQIVRDLAAQSDVLVENFRPSVMHKFGLDQARLRADNPRLIYVSISAYGANSSSADRPGFDPVLQAESGMMALTGSPDDPPTRHPLSIIDTMTANHASTAICAALFARQQTDRGEFIDLSLMDTSINMLANAAGHYLATDEVPPRSGNSHMFATPTDLFRTATQPIYLAVSSDKLFGQFCRDVLLRPDLPDDPRFRSSSDRFAHRPLLKAEIEAVLMQHPQTHWLPKLRHLPAGAVRGLDEALDAPETAEREMVATIDDPEGPIRVLGSPFKFQDTPLAPYEPPPHLGEHTDEVLRTWLSYSDAHIDTLRDRGAIGAKPPG